MMTKSSVTRSRRIIPYFSGWPLLLLLLLWNHDNGSIFVVQGFQRTVLSSRTITTTTTSREWLPTQQQQQQQRATTGLLLPVIRLQPSFSVGSTSSTSLSLSSSAIDISSNNGGSNVIEKISSAFGAAVDKIRKVDEKTWWRMAAYTFVSSLWVFHQQIDAQLVNVWQCLKFGTGWFPRMFRHDHWEWGLAVSAFFVWIHGFYIMDKILHRYSQQQGPNDPDHPWRKYRLQDEYELQRYHQRQERRRRKRRGNENDSSTKNIAFASTFEANVEEPRPKTSLQPWNWKAWIFELPLYMLPLYIWDVLQPRRHLSIAKWGAPTTFGICRDVTCGLLLYDLGFFCVHYMMHKFTWIYKMFHAKHHINTEVRAADIVRLSGVEEVLDVGISILALRYLGCHPVSRTIYNTIITFLLTELHCGYDLPWTPQNVVPFGLSTGSRGHHYHHRFGKHYYQKFFCTVDRLFGFVDKKKQQHHQTQPVMA